VNGYFLIVTAGKVVFEPACGSSTANVDLLASH